MTPDQVIKPIARVAGLDYGIKPRVQKPSLGVDTGARTIGQTYLPTGIPLKPEHRKFFGIPSPR